MLEFFSISRNYVWKKIEKCKTENVAQFRKNQSGPFEQKKAVS